MSYQAIAESISNLESDKSRLKWLQEFIEPTTIHITSDSMYATFDWDSDGNIITFKNRLPNTQPLVNYLENMGLKSEYI